MALPENTAVASSVHTPTARRTWPALGLVLACAAALRLAGIGFGLPFELRPDEEVFRQSVARMAETGDLNPHRFEYGGTLYHALYGVARLVHAAYAVVDPGGAGSFAAFTRRAPEMALIQRVMSAVLGTWTVLLVFGIGRRLGSRSGGLIGAVLLSIMFLAARDSHFGTVDIPAAFAATWAVSLILRAGQTGTLASFAAAGVIAGLATAIRYTPGVLAFPLWIAARRVEREGGRKGLSAWFGPRVLVAGGAMVGGVLLAAPYTFLAFDDLKQDILGAYLRGGRPDLAPLARLGRIVTVDLVNAVDWPFAVASGLALIAALPGRRPEGRVLAVFVLAFVALIATSTVFFMRWLNPIVPALCALVGWAVDRVPWPAWSGPIGRIALTAALAVVPATRTVCLDALFVRDTTFEQAAQFVRDRIPEGSAVACAEPDVAYAFRAAFRLEPWDPYALQSRPVWYAIVPRHPFGTIGTDPALASVVLPAMGEVTTLATFTGLEPTDWRRVEFDPGDSFFYPLRGFRSVLHVGPDLTVVRVVPRPPESRAAAPPAPVLSATVDQGTLSLSFEPPPGIDVVAYYVRYSSNPDSGEFRGPYAVPPGTFGVSYARGVMRGRVSLVGATITSSGVGPWSKPVQVTID
jgi:hypothetical protein